VANEGLLTKNFPIFCHDRGHAILLSEGLWFEYGLGYGLEWCFSTKALIYNGLLN
jgi:hypothetical protein